MRCRVGRKPTLRSIERTSCQGQRAASVGAEGDVWGPGVAGVMFKARVFMSNAVWSLGRWLERLFWLMTNSNYSELLLQLLRK
jgi:hypothetical protein